MIAQGYLYIFVISFLNLFVQILGEFHCKMKYIIEKLIVFEVTILRIAAYNELYDCKAFSLFFDYETY